MDSDAGPTRTFDAAREGSTLGPSDSASPLSEGGVVPAAPDGNAAPREASAGAEASAALDSSTAGVVDATSTFDGASADGSPSAADESAWLNPMNQARAAVGEAPLSWDPIAAQVALSYAMQCNYQHNPNASAQYRALGGKSGLGENIAGGAPSVTISGAVQGWLGEAASYDHATNSCAAGKDCGHYTQIVWAATSGVGCAIVNCTANSPFGSFAGGKWTFAVCDFSPPGNVVGQSPY
jgi:uncharacterized protein YkwD